MPFASERRLLRTEDLWNKGELEQRQHYKQLMASLLQNLVSGFRDDSVNVVMAHLTIDGAKRAYSEVDFYTRNTYSLAGQMLPPEAQYIALGHIHKPQQIPNAAPTYYSGSLIQIDFGEAGEDKGFNLVTVESGSPAKVEFKPLSCPKPLKVLRCDESNLEETLEANREHLGFLKVIVTLNAPKMGLADQVRKVCPQALMIEALYQTVKEEKPIESQETTQFDAVEEFSRYWRERMKTTVPPSVLNTFEELHKELSDAPH